MHLLFGLVTIPAFMYRFRLSVAYYELIALDVARVEYDTDEPGGQLKKADDESIRLNEESLKKARARYEENQWEQMKLSELT